MSAFDTSNKRNGDTKGSRWRPFDNDYFLGLKSTLWRSTLSVNRLNVQYKQFINNLNHKKTKKSFHLVTAFRILSFCSLDYTIVFPIR